MATARFKSYSQNQAYLIPPSWEEKIPFNHPVRIVNRIIDNIDISKLYASYLGGGTSSYDPRMLLKGIVYSYINNIYSSRKIEETIKSNINFIWLCGGSEPDHNTINRFRSTKSAKYLKDVFKQIVLLLGDEGLLSLKAIFIDGTKIEANANRYSFVWGKSLQTNKAKMLKQIDELWQYTQEIAKEELKDTEPLNFKTIDKEKLDQTIQRIDAAIKDKEVPIEVKKKFNNIKKNYPKKLEDYEHKAAILEGRNSYSKTDPDATFMRMKEDHMNKGQLKAAYNVQISTNNQIITNYDIYPNPNDTLTLPSHIESFKSLYNKTPEIITTDSGYGSDQNYEYLEQNAITGYIPYNYFNQEQQGIRQKKHPFLHENLYYNTEQDYYVCPMGQHMENMGSSKKNNESGFEQTITRYQAKNCKGCPLRGVCNKGDGNRIIEVNHRLNRHKHKARINLTSEEGIYYRSRRGQEVESVFGNIKQNKNFRRFTFRGKNNVTTEFGLIAIAHNLSKLITQKQKY